jgi:TRAP transporter TAXI family solute receptor
MRAGLASAGALALGRLLPGRAAAQDVRYFRIGTGETGGSLFVLGGVIAGVVSNPPGSRSCDDGGSCGVPGLIALAQASAGSVENVTAIGAGTLDSGLSQADVAEWALQGKSIFAAQGPIASLTAIANLYQESLHVIVHGNGKIKTIADLRGKRVGFGPKNAGNMLLAGLVLKALGLSEKRLKPDYSDLAIAIAQFEADELDALMIVDAVPLPAIVDLAKRRPIALLNIDGDKIDELRRSVDFLGVDVIPPDSYAGVATVTTLGVGVLWVVSKDQDPQLVYDLTKSLWNPGNRKLLDESGALGRQVKPDSAQLGIPIPIHPGAQRYYTEILQAPPASP